MINTILSQSNIDTPQIYVACLSSYVNGSLHGCYIDATQNPKEIREEIEQMLSESPLADTEEPCEG